MTTKFVVSKGLPDGDFWKKFAVLWQNSADRSPFKSPQILRYFAEQTKEHLLVLQFSKYDVLHGAVLLKEHNGVCTFLSDMKTDVNFFVLDRRCADEEKRQFFEAFLQTIKRERWSVVLNNQPSWAHYMPQLEAVGKNSGLFWMNFAYSVCPIAEAESPEALFERVQHAHKFRYYANRLAKIPGTTFEVFVDGTDLEQWTAEYCQTHIRRWTNTPTPSDFQDTKRREFLIGCLRAWNEDGVLVRFSINMANRQRIGFVIALLEENSVVFHATTFEPEFAKFSPGKALIHDIVSWMAKQKIRILDFGDGNETYKYEVANQEHVLNRIFICGKTQLPFIAKTKIIKFVKDHPKLYQMYQHNLKPLAAKAAALFHLPEILEMLFV